MSQTHPTSGSSINPAFPCILRLGSKMKGHLAPASRRHLGTKRKKTPPCLGEHQQVGEFMSYHTTSYIVPKNTYLKQMLDSDFGHPCLATFHSPFCMANLAKGTPDMHGLIAQVEVVMPHSEYTHLAQKLNNMSP